MDADGHADTSGFPGIKASIKKIKIFIDFELMINLLI
jgi:hypothetical protein